MVIYKSLNFHLQIWFFASYIIFVCTIGLKEEEKQLADLFFHVRDQPWCRGEGRVEGKGEWATPH